MELTFGSKIKEARKTLNLTQKQLANAIGAKHNSVSDWENDKNKPDPDTIELLCGILKITPNYLLASSEDDFSPKEKHIIKKYRSLDDFGRETIDIALDRETERVTSLKNRDKHIQELEKESISHSDTCTYPYLGKIACAGTGFYFDDIPTDTIEAPYVEGADFIIGVSGESMEPDYHDGEKLYVRKVEYLRNGDVGIFTIGNECFLKELGENGLISRNKNYDDVPGDEKIRLVGKVIGKVEI